MKAWVLSHNGKFGVIASGAQTGVSNRERHRAAHQGEHRTVSDEDNCCRGSVIAHRMVPRGCECRCRDCVRAMADNTPRTFIGIDYGSQDRTAHVAVTDPETMAYLQACSELVERIARENRHADYWNDALTLMETHGRRP